MQAFRPRISAARVLWRRSLTATAAKEHRDEEQTLRAFKRMIEDEPHVVASRLTPHMLRDLQRVVEGVSTTLAVEKPTSRQLRLVFLHQMVPFIGFGFLDNFTMIMAGDYIDMTLGTSLGLSTLAAAGLGNWFSDLVGLGAGGWIGHSTESLGIPNPSISEAQHALTCTRLAKTAGMTFGVTIGCFLGMIPLLFMNTDRGRDKEKESKQSDS